MDTRVDEALQGFRTPVAGGGLQRMMKLMPMDGNPTLHGGVELIENRARSREGRGLSFNANPTIPRGHSDLKTSLQFMKETRIVAVESLGRPGIFEFQGY
jgi:hypothetical protein